jgi:uncharacterized membrane protein YgaE (UPF0421/DUF939 family)
MRRLVSLQEAQLALRAAVAGGLAAWCAIALALPHPIYAFIAAVIVTDLSPAKSRQMGGRRLIATLIGAILGTALLFLLGAGPMTVTIGVAVAMLLSYALGFGDAARVSAYLCGIVVLEHVDEPLVYAVQRFVETVLGVALAWAISGVPKLFARNQKPDA